MRSERIDRMVRAYGIDATKWPEAGELSEYDQVSPSLLRAAAQVDAALLALAKEPPALGILEDQALAEAAIARSIMRKRDRWPIRAAAASILFASILGAATGSFNEMSRGQGTLFSTKQGLWTAQVQPLTGGLE